MIALRSFIPAFSARHILGMAVLFVSMRRPLGMIGGIFHALNCSCFQSLLRVGQLLDRFFIRLGDGGKSLRIA